jgi:hypothetical protein
VELNRRTKLVGGVLALAVAGLIYDRVITGGGPATADAAPVQPTVEGAKPADSGTTPENKGNVGKLADRLAALDEDLGGPGVREDAFVAPVGWFPVDDTIAAPATVVAKPGHGHVINSVLRLRDKEVKSVVVDGKMLRPQVPVKFEEQGKEWTYELVKAWVDDDQVTHVEFKVNGQLMEIHRRFVEQ